MSGGTEEKAKNEREVFGKKSPKGPLASRRTTMAGGVIFEVLGNKGWEMTVALAARLSAVFDPAMVPVTALFRTAELKVAGMDVSIAKTELKKTLAQKGRWRGEKIQAEDIRITRTCLRIVWARCPLGATRKLAQEDKVTLGWSTAKTEAIGRIPLR